jgi:hypothetical protein
LYDWHQLRARAVDPTKEAFTWYVLQNRPGLFTDTDRALIRAETPAFRKYAGRRSQYAAVPHDLDVPLIYVFSFEQYHRAWRRK